MARLSKWSFHLFFPDEINQSPTMFCCTSSKYSRNVLYNQTSLLSAFLVK
jgi:hypothetical protein